MSTFMGIPIEGRIERSSRRETVQYAMEELTPRIEKILSDPRVEAIRWTQYTPYFNDGETCVFGLGDVQLKITDAPVDEEYGSDEGFIYIHSPVVNGGQLSQYSSIKRVWESYGPVLPALEQLEEISSLGKDFDHFEDVLRDTFGDHATVTVSTDSVTVEYFEHD